MGHEVAAAGQAREAVGPAAEGRPLVPQERTQLPHPGGRFLFTPAEFAAFRDGVRNGEFDHLA